MAASTSLQTQTKERNCRASAAGSPMHCGPVSSARRHLPRAPVATRGGGVARHVSRGSSVTSTSRQEERKKKKKEKRGDKKYKSRASA